MAFNPSLIPDSLKRAYQDKRCAVLVGAGASAGAGLPLWGALLDQMISAAEGESVITPDRAAEYRKLLARPDKFLMVASGLKEDIGSLFDEFIDKTFVASHPKPTALHQSLTALEKLPFVLTTNYDTLIEDAYQSAGKKVAVCTFLDAGEIQRRIAKREFFLLKAHGDAARLGNGIVLTDVDYRDLLYNKRGYQSMLSTMFTICSIVFVGASMADPEINLLLNYLADAFSATSGPMHYALLSKEDITDVEKNRWRKDFKIQIIPISKADNYAELTEFLVELQKA
jgi:hypothetical protein